MYLVVKDFEKSVEFYEKFLGTKVENRCRSENKFVEFYIDNPNGQFSREETMEEQIESCIPFLMEDGACKTVEEAREKLRTLFPTLKRWRR